VLYVEDDRDLVKMITYGLSNNANILHAPTLKSARELLAKRHIDLILLDITLPDGSGLSLLDTLKEDEKTPVIIFSAREISKDISENVKAVLIKSRTSEKQIVSTIRSIITKNINYH
jgi:DNA-binding response OmpR family regulator